MPINFRKQPATLQEKVDKAIRLTYQIHDTGDSEFMRAFIIDLLEKAYLKVKQDVEKVDGVFYQQKINHPDKDIMDLIIELKREQE